MSADQLFTNVRAILTFCMALALGGMILAGSGNSLGHAAEKAWMQVTAELQQRWGLLTETAPQLTGKTSGKSGGKIEPR